MSWQTLKIVRGSTEINLIDEDGWFLLDWEPAISEWEDGGIWADNKSTSGRTPVYGVLGNTVESMTLGLAAASKASGVSKIDTLLDVLISAFNYWQPGSVEPDIVYLLAKETSGNNKYAPLAFGQIPNVAEIKRGPWESGVKINGTPKVVGMKDIGLTLERKEWMSGVPGTATAVPVTESDGSGTQTTALTTENHGLNSQPHPYAEVNAADAAWKVSALLRIKAQSNSNTDGPGDESPGIPHQTRVMAGLRTKSRGANFRPYINLAGGNNATGISISLVDAGSSAFSLAATGQGAVWTIPTGQRNYFIDVVEAVFDNTIAAHYYGDFHVFARVICEGTELGGLLQAGDVAIRAQVRAGSGGVISTSRQARIGYPHGSSLELLDLGEISIPGDSTLLSSDTVDSLRLTIQAKTVSANALNEVWLADVILLPVDEWFVDCIDNSKSTASYLGQGRYLDIDSVLNMRVGVRSWVKSTANDRSISRWNPIMAGSVFLQPGLDQRIFFLSGRHLTSVGTHIGSSLVYTLVSSGIINPPAAVGDTVYNLTKGSAGVITSIVDDQVVAQMSGGTNLGYLWHTGDVYAVVSRVMVSVAAGLNVQLFANGRYRHPVG